MKGRRYKLKNKDGIFAVSACSKWLGITLALTNKYRRVCMYLTPAQARRIAAHLVKLAEMREGEKRA